MLRLSFPSNFCFGLTFFLGLSTFVFCLPPLTQGAEGPQLTSQIVPAPMQPKVKYVTQTIDLNSAVADYARVKDVSIGQAWGEAMNHLGFATPGNQNGIVNREVRPGVLEITAPDSFLQMLPAAIESLHYGAKQIVVEVRIMMVREEMLQRLAGGFRGGWEVSQGAPSPKVVSKKSNPFRLPTADLRTSTAGDRVRQNPIQVLKDNVGKVSPPAEFVSAISRMEQVSPCRYAKLDATAVERLVKESQDDSTVSILQAPKVTMFAGQDATIEDATQRPFVVAVKPVEGEFATAMQPVIEVVTEGVQVGLNLIPEDGKIKVSSRIEFSHIDEVETFSFQTEGMSEETTIQIPKRRVEQIELIQRLDEGTSLLVAPRFFREKTVKKGFPRRDEKVREYLMILLSPTVIEQPK